MRNACSHVGLRNCTPPRKRQAGQLAPRASWRRGCGPPTRPLRGPPRLSACSRARKARLPGAGLPGPIHARASRFRIIRHRSSPYFLGPSRDEDHDLADRPFAIPSTTAPDEVPPATGRRRLGASVGLDHASQMHSPFQPRDRFRPRRCRFVLANADIWLIEHHATALCDKSTR